MSHKRHLLRDRFTFSLRGMTATASYFITPVLADDRINRAWDQKLSEHAHQNGAPDAENSRSDLPLGRSWSRSAG
jgi:hypothetical protein